LTAESRGLFPVDETTLIARAPMGHSTTMAAGRPRL
jgi:hypothetical protein